MPTEPHSSAGATSSASAPAASVRATNGRAMAGRAGASSATLLAALAAFAVGLLAAVQSRANGMLATTWQSPIDAALWSFGSGWVVLTLGLLHPSARAGLRRARAAYREGHLQWWQFLGGLGGGFLVGTQAWAVPQVGVALFTIAIVGGQTANALFVDGIGLGPAGKSPVTPARVVAALATFAGVVVAMLGRGAGASGLPVLVIAVCVVAGAGMAVQQAINGRVNRHSGNVMATTWVNFTWGLTLLLGFTVAQVATGEWHRPASFDQPWWSLLGGLIGIVFIAVAAVVVHTLGVLQATLTTLAGQLLGAVLVDIVSGVGVNGLVLLGVLITLVSAAGAGLAARRTARR